MEVDIKEYSKSRVIKELDEETIVRPSGQRNANAQYYFAFTFITSTV